MPRSRTEQKRRKLEGVSRTAVQMLANSEFYELTAGKDEPFKAFACRGADASFITAPAVVVNPMSLVDDVSRAAKTGMSILVRSVMTPIVEYTDQMDRLLAQSPVPHHRRIVKSLKENVATLAELHQEAVIWGPNDRDMIRHWGNRLDSGAFLIPSYQGGEFVNAVLNGLPFRWQPNTTSDKAEHPAMLAAPNRVEFMDSVVLVNSRLHVYWTAILTPENITGLLNAGIDLYIFAVRQKGKKCEYHALIRAIIDPDPIENLEEVDDEKKRAKDKTTIKYTVSDLPHLDTDLNQRCFAQRVVGNGELKKAYAALIPGGLPWRKRAFRLRESASDDAFLTQLGMRSYRIGDESGSRLVYVGRSPSGNSPIFVDIATKYSILLHAIQGHGKSSTAMMLASQITHRQLIVTFTFGQMEERLLRYVKHMGGNIITVPYKDPGLDMLSKAIDLAIANGKKDALALFREGLKWPIFLRPGIGTDVCARAYILGFLQGFEEAWPAYAEAMKVYEEVAVVLDNITGIPSKTQFGRAASPTSSLGDKFAEQLKVLQNDCRKFRWWFIMSTHSLKYVTNLDLDVESFALRLTMKDDNRTGVIDEVRPYNCHIEEPTIDLVSPPS